MQGRMTILDRTPKEIDDVTKKVLLMIYFEFVFPNQNRDYEVWEAGMLDMNQIGRTA